MKIQGKNKALNGHKIGQIMGINVISAGITEVLARVRGLISDNIKFYIVTPNPELILMAQKDKKLKEALNDASLSIPDGVGLNYASKFLFDENIIIIPGRKLFIDLVDLAHKKDWKIFLLGGRGDEARLTARRLKVTYRNLEIRSSQGPELDNSGEPVTEIDKKLQSDAFLQISSFKPQLLFVAFGNPKQEIWIHRNLSKLNIGGAMAVGGAFRYLAGLSKLPPEWLQKAGLEWLWRLIKEPVRAGRIFNAVIVFPWKVLIYKMARLLC